MARTADPDRLLDHGSIEIPFVLLVMVACPRNEVMTRQRLLTTANRTGAFHTLPYEQPDPLVVKAGPCRHFPFHGKQMAAGCPAAIRIQSSLH